MANYIRVWKQLDIEDIKGHLLVVGQTSGFCENCNSVVVDYKQKVCPSCNSKFKYVALRSEGITLSFYKKLQNMFKDFICIDYNDYKRSIAKKIAKDIFK